MGFREIILCAAALGSSSALAAQNPAPASAGRIAVIASPPTVTPVNSPSSFGPQGSLWFANIPILVFADGRVFADFGYGYEHVARSCALSTSYVLTNGIPLQPTVVQPTVVQPSVPTSTLTMPATQPPVTPTVTQPMTAPSIQPAQGVSLNSQACWAVDNTGRVFVGRP
jgi:hypothetical protein